MIPYRRTYWFEFVCKLMFTEEDMHVEASLFYIIRINKIVNEINFITCFRYSMRGSAIRLKRWFERMEVFFLRVKLVDE